MPAVPASIPTSLKLPGALKLQLEKDAKQMGKSLGQTFAQDSADALAVMNATGSAHALEDARVYFSQLKEHRQGKTARPAPLQPKKIG